MGAYNMGTPIIYMPLSMFKTIIQRNVFKGKMFIPQQLLLLFPGPFLRFSSLELVLKKRFFENSEPRHLHLQRERSNPCTSPR